MAKFLTTVGNSYYLEQIIINSNQSLTLVAPYLKLSKNFIDRLSDADRQGVNITLIYGKIELHDDEKETLYAFSNIEIYYCEHLHAKCYYNENAMIITSMNLYEFSERNNREMGLFIQKESDPDIFRDALKEIDSIKNSAILKKKSNNSQARPESFYSIEDGYEEQWNFHLPSLKKVLMTNYPNFIVGLDRELTMLDFPKQGVNLEVGYRADFQFKVKNEYLDLKKKFGQEIRQALGTNRIYWNNMVANIYLPPGYQSSMDPKGLKEKTLVFKNIIDTMYSFLKE